MNPIRIDLDNIGAAVSDLEKVKAELRAKNKKFLDELARWATIYGTMHFGEAIYDGTNDVIVTKEDRGEGKVAIVATSPHHPDVPLFIEFGTGVVYPDTHPEAGTLGMIRGEYGYHLGKSEKGWRYHGDPGTNGEIIEHGGEEWVKTYGNPANMSLWQTVRDLEEIYEEVAREVFK